MYLHCKSGFFEVDAWDGTPVPSQRHQAAVDRLAAKPGEVVVVRCRVRAQLADLLKRYGPVRSVLRSPVGWDYPFRAYLTAGEWASTMAAVALDLDYRNFKTWCRTNAPEQAMLAHEVWHAALSPWGSR